MGKAQLDELNRSGMYLSVPKGISMKPMIKNKEGICEIHKLKNPPKKYDLVVYLRPDYQGVIHRVIDKNKDYYIIMGDNCWQKEYVKREQIIGIVTRFYRNGKWYDVDNKLYLLYVHIWVDFLFIKRPLFYVRDKLKRLFYKLKKNINKKNRVVTCNSIFLFMSLIPEEPLRQS